MSQIDPRGPRFGAAITSVIALACFSLAFGGEQLPAGALIALLAALFGWSVTAPKTHPYALLFAKLVRPHLEPPTELEDSRPPRFAQQVGLSFALAGLLGFALQSTLLLAIAAAFIFAAAFLNSVFDFCLGCQVYLLLKRAGLLRK